MPRMKPAKSIPQPMPLPDALRPLAAELAKLSEQERELVISAARAANTTGRRHATISWASLMSAKGVVSFGGNAVEDCDALYDGFTSSASCNDGDATTSTSSLSYPTLIV
jgi:hypothetical protein